MTVATKLLTAGAVGVVAGLLAGLEGFLFTAWALERGGEPAADGLHALTAFLVAGVFALETAVVAGAAVGFRLSGRRLAARVALAALAVALVAEHVVLLRGA